MTTIDVISDVICPWCYVGGVRLRTLEREGAVRLEWRSFLLRPRPDPERTLEKFRAYTQSWRRPAAEPDVCPPGASPAAAMPGVTERA